MKPPLINMVDNGSLVQFEHRTLAYLITAFVVWIIYRASRLRRGRAPRAVQYVFMACLLQVGLGIATVASGTPVALGVLHQAGAIVFLTSALYLVHRLKAAERTGALA
jgi:cytochrome c oxidase assembly protein subunit 15